MTTPAESRRAAPNRRLMELRINEGLSPNELGYQAGISGKTVRMAEAGFLPSPRVQHAIATVFNLRPTEIWPLHVQVAR
jgi:DNA-binding XRE family transcriptional regulator